MPETFSILYVDDETTLLDIGKLFLEQGGGLNVDTITSAPAALTLMQEKNYDAVISDYQMPGMDGIEFLKRVRASGNTIPFIIFTGRGREEIVIQALNEGADFYLQKGGEPKAQYAELSNKIRYAITRRRAEDALRESEGRVRKKLDALLSPSGEIGTLDLADIFDMPAVQVLMNDFYALTKIGIGIIDLHGKVLVATGWQDICTQFHRVNPGTCKNCMESDLQLTAETAPGTSRMYRCKNNMWDIVTPMYVGKTHIGNIFLGQFLFEDETIDYELFRAQARQYGFNEAEYLAALNRVPRWSREKVDTIMRFYTRFAGMISSLGYSNLRLARTLTARDQLLTSLTESEERYRSAVNDQTELIARFTPDGVITFVNEAYRLYYNPWLTAKEVVGKTIRDVMQLADTDELEKILRSLTRENPIQEIERGQTDPEGNRRWQIWTVRALFKKDGTLSEYQFVGRDITRRKTAEESLRVSEEQYRELAENMSDIVWQVDPRLVFTYLSPSVTHQIGYAPVEIVGKSLLDFITPASSENFRSQMAQRKGMSPDGSFRGSATYLFELIRKDGSVLVSEAVTNPVYDNDGHFAGWRGIARDITDRKRAEARISEINRSYLEFSTDPVGNINILTSLAGRLLQGTCALYNRLEGGMLCSLGMWNAPPGYAPCDEPEGHICSDIINKGSSAPTVIHNLLDSSYADSDPNVRKYQLQTYVGIPVKIGGKFLGSLCIVYQHAFTPSPAELEILPLLAQAIAIEDERRTALQALEESEDRLGKAMGLAQIVAWEFDHTTGMFTFDDRFYALYGTTAEREGGYLVPFDVYTREFVHPDDARRVNAEIEDAIRNFPHGGQIEHRIIRRDGGIRQIVVHYTVIMDPRGEPLKIRGVNQDVTGQKQIENALRQANRKLSLLSGITRHDITNQLLAMTGFLTLLRVKAPDPNLDVYFDRIRKAGTVISSLIQFTREYEKIGIAAASWQDCRRLVERAAQEAQLGDVTVENGIPAGTEMLADPLIARVFYNLTDNAIRHGGKITTIRFLAEELSGTLVISIEDDGKGIPENEKERIFERGFGKNSGLGLALSREILDITGITIGETGEPGKGAKFVITVPEGAYRFPAGKK